MAFTPKTVLVIDDDESFRGFIADLLGEYGYGVATATSGKEGLAAACKNDFDVIITEMILPDMNGSELIAAMRQRGLKTPIIAITGQPCGEAGLAVAETFDADCIMYKPCTAREMLLTIESLFINGRFRPVRHFLGKTGTMKQTAEP